MELFQQVFTLTLSRMALSRNLWQHFNPNRAPSHLQTSVMVWDKHKLMIDLHVHIAVSSIPRTPGLPVGEALRFAALNGYRAVGLILRSSELDMPPLMPLAKDIKRLSLHANIEAVLGVELVHIPPALLPEAVDNAREAGAGLVLAHGETLLENVEEGTNFAAIMAGVDILAHPGLIDEQAAVCAAERGVALELSCAPRHAFANAHIIRMAEQFGCVLVPGSSAAAHGEILPPRLRDRLYRGAGLTGEAAILLQHNARKILQKQLVC